MANEKPTYVLARQRRAAEQTSRSAEEAARLADEAATLRAHQPMARLAFLALVGMLLYLSTVAYNTTHLDLLLNTKVGVIWSLVELPRRWVLGVGSLVLAVIHYEAISLHHRVDRQFQAWYSALPKNEAIQHRYLLWLHGGLISDQYSSGISGRWLSAMSQVVLYGVLWVAPVFALTFLQAVVMPVHSEWLSNSVRLSLIIVVLLVGYSAFQRYIKEKSAKPKWLRVRLGGCIAGSICTFGMYLSLHVFLWPGEALQWLQAEVVPASSVWEPTVDSSTVYRSFFGLSCGVSNANGWWSDTFWKSQDAANYIYSGYRSDSNYGNTNYGGWIRKQFSTSKPQSTRADFGSNISFISTPDAGWQCPERDEKTVISTQLLRGWIGHQFKRLSPNYNLTDQIINGRSLTPEERDYLSTHTAEQPLHPKFQATLDQLNPLDLSSEDLRYGIFCNAWLPMVKLPDARKMEGTVFCGAKMQGVQLEGWKEKPAVNEIGFSSRLNGIDLSGGSLFGGHFEDLTLRFTAISARIQGLKLNGVALENSDWRFATIDSPEFLLSYSIPRDRKSSISHSKLDGSSINQPQFHATEIVQSSFVGAVVSNPLFFKGTKIKGGDFSMANFAAPSEDYAGENLVTWEDSKLDFTQFLLRDRRRHVFDKNINGSSNGPTLIVGTLYSGPKKNNLIGPLWISKEFATAAERTSLYKASENYWLVQQQWRKDFGATGGALINETYYQNVLQRCESGNISSLCYGFSPTLQSLAQGTMRELCESYAAYVPTDVANTLFTAFSGRSSKELSFGFDMSSKEEQRMKFMSCLKDKHGRPRASRALNK
jgi:uncharacterized protein YjbI with pentapeptide repeats